MGRFTASVAGFLLIALSAQASVPRFSDLPTDDELRWQRIFPEPLVAFGDATVAPTAENRALGDAILAFLGQPEIDDFAALEAFLRDYPTSRWRASLLLNLGLLQYRTGHFSDALASWRAAWAIGRDATGPAEKAVADQILAQLALLSARLGRTLELTELIAETRGRGIDRPSELLRHARDGLGMMYNEPGVAFRCGPLALGRAFAAKGMGSPLDPRIEALRSTPCGLPLSRVAALAEDLKMELRPAKRIGAAPITFPAVVYWRSGHFAALVEARTDVKGTLRYHVEDPTFSDDLWVTERALREEGSGYFLIAKSAPEREWRSVSSAEAASVWGRGFTSGSDAGGTGGIDGVVGGSAGAGGGERGGTGGDGPGAGGAGGSAGFGAGSGPPQCLGGGPGGGGSGGDGGGGSGAGGEAASPAGSPPTLSTHCLRASASSIHRSPMRRRSALESHLP